MAEHHITLYVGTWKAVFLNAANLAAIGAAIALAKYLDSTVLEWIAGGLGILHTLSLIFQDPNRHQFTSIGRARDFLDGLEKPNG
jgi:hypothetical protein